jgi:hypothetical protein
MESSVQRKSWSIDPSYGLSFVNMTFSFVQFDVHAEEENLLAIALWLRN